MLRSALFGVAALSLVATTGDVQGQVGAGADKKGAASEGAVASKVPDSSNHLLRRDKDAPALSPAQQANVNKATSMPEMKNVSVFKMPDAATVENLLSRAPPQDERYAKVVLPLSGDKNITLLRTRPTVKTDDGFTWRGKAEDTDEPAVLMLWKDGHLSGYFAHEGSIFMVNSLGGNVHTVAEFDPSTLPPEHPPGTPGTTTLALTAEPTVTPFPDAERQALEAKNIIIDIMILYTKNAADKHIGNPADLLALKIEETNEALRNSGLGNISLRLVHSQMVDYDETGSNLFTSLYKMVDGADGFKDVKKLRDEKRADVVGLIIDNPSGCGLSTRVGAGPDEAFFVVHHSCASVTNSIAHEVAHLIGARHDRAFDANDSPFAYAHGYVNGTKWRDMMSYKEACNGCPRIPYWSNPRIMYKGEPTGTAASDNARVILEQAERVSKFR
jgi:hypothetical protein